MVLEDNKKATTEEKRESSEKKPQSRSSQTENPTMTYAQKRYLFKILAEHGIEGEEAHEKLKELFQVDSLKEVSKLEASKMIEQLLEERKGGDNGPPF